jgi:hypothetical protein
MNKMNTRKLVLSLSVLFLFLISAVAVGAAGDFTGTCVGNVAVVDGNSICFMGQAPDASNPGYTTWTYGVQRDVAASGNGLSHITFDLCIDDPLLVVPTNGDTYTTPGSYGAHTGIAGVDYSVVVSSDPDPTTQVGGIKFEDPTAEQLEDEVHIFQFSQPTQQNPGAEYQYVGFKNGNTATQAEILGPICDGSSAVELTSFKAQSMSLFSRILQWLGLR